MLLKVHVYDHVLTYHPDVAYSPSEVFAWLFTLGRYKMRILSLAVLSAIFIQYGGTQTTSDTNDTLGIEQPRNNQCNSTLPERCNSTSVTYGASGPDLDWVQYVSKAVITVTRESREYLNQIQLMGVRVGVSWGARQKPPTLDLDDFVHTTLIFKAWHMREKRWERRTLWNEHFGKTVKPRRYGTWDEWGGLPFGDGAWHAWGPEDDEEFNGAQSFDWSMFAVRNPGWALSPHELIPLVQQSRNPAVPEKIKQGGWREIMIFNYAQPVAGLKPGMTYRVISTAMGLDDDCIAGTSAFVDGITHQVVPMDPSKEWKIAKHPWGYGGDNRNTPEEIGPFTFLDRLRNGDALVRGMGYGYFRQVELIQIELTDRKFISAGGKYWNVDQFRRYTDVRLTYRLVRGGQTTYYSYWASLNREIELDIGAPRKWSHWPISPGVIRIPAATEIIKIPGSSLWNPDLLASMDISGLEMDLPQAWSLWNSKYAKGWDAAVETMYLTQLKQSVSTDVDQQPSFYWDATGILLGTRSGVAMKHDPSTGQWQRFPVGLSLTPGNSTSSTIPSPQNLSDVTVSSGFLRLPQQSDSPANGDKTNVS